MNPFRQLALVAGLVAACVLPPHSFAESSNERPVLKILNWDDYIAPEVITAYEQQYGVQVEYSYYANLDGFVEQFLDPDKQFDLIFPPSHVVNKLAEKKLIRDLDSERLPELGAIRVDITNEYDMLDEGARSAVPYMWGTTGLGVNIAKLQALGLGDYIDSWALVFDPEVRAKAKQCGIGLLNERDELFAGALAYLGYSVNTMNKDELQQAGELLKATAADVTYLHTVQFRQDLTDKKICVAVGYSGDLLVAAGDDPELAYFIPREGNALWIDAMAIPTNSPSPDRAYEFMNYLMQAEVAAENSNYLEYPNPMASSAPYVDPDILNDETIYPALTALNHMEALAPRDRKTTRMMHKLWVGALCNRGGWCSVPMMSMF